MQLLPTKPQENGKEFFSFTVYVTGIKNRCRKSEHHGLFLGYSDYKNLTSEELQSLISQAKMLIDVSMKEVASNRYIVLKGHVNKKEKDFTTCELFDKRNIEIKINPVDGVIDYVSGVGQTSLIDWQAKQILREINA